MRVYFVSCGVTATLAISAAASATGPVDVSMAATTSLDPFADGHFGDAGPGDLAFSMSGDLIGESDLPVGLDGVLAGGTPVVGQFGGGEPTAPTADSVSGAAAVPAPLGAGLAGVGLCVIAAHRRR